MTAAVDVTDGVRRDVARAPLAAWWRRAVAAALDAAVVGAVTFVTVGPGGWPWEWSLVLGGVAPAPRTPVLLVAGATAVVLLALQAWTGATPGKRVVGIAVLGSPDALAPVGRSRPDRPLGAWRTAVRTLAHSLDLVLLVGLVRPLWDPRRRTFADALCGTDVRATRRVARRAHPHGRRGTTRARGGGGWATTAAAVVLCATSVALAAGVSTGRSPEVVVACGLDDAPMGDDPPIATVELRVPESRTQTRLGLTRAVDGPRDATVSWVVAEQQEAPDGTRLSVRVVAGDGTQVAELGGTVDRGTLVPDHGPALGGLLLPVPPRVLAAAGPGGTWEAGVGTDDVRVALCGGALGGS
ncbi:RDD family protein [Cellulomonas fimi]|uniref:RDD domain containing protein n=1 Tax=Cellulomonas fimi (strain ATCC 484 / DSM 20113 / JCM 1341 / CCUG 24087 / LMG 16345 / NBRC 15513 / NCIMB 8980 / NCTC 7547 / NRS-133) TaxID=590998 RepID=F4H5N9_CELFA|nr:RDD family protein [Cellulomonas fimi]AEE44363.1 RDD domain containing protein [Cellulomonas fimi ATCC 484]NNH08657.1 hypothetical protein [Cellulomonas fimi]VEH26208.1 RDD family [Cellulomonas fimi]